jgi:hypothetical protein
MSSFVHGLIEKACGRFLKNFSSKNVSISLTGECFLFCLAVLCMHVCMFVWVDSTFVHL